MTGSMIGLVGGIIGGILGTAGGLIGTYFSIKNTNGPRERNFMIRAAIVVWIIVVLYVALGFLLPSSRPWLNIPYAILLTFGIRHLNRRQSAIKQDEETKN